MAATPLILDIRANSLDDGPGIRSVVFFKGCPLSCTWCHNPESQRLKTEIGFGADLCTGCDTCLAVCPEGALDRSLALFVDRVRCSLCFACTDACPSGALTRVGRAMDVDEIVAFVARDKPFFQASGGGVTLSGGEPTLFMDFLSRLLRGFRDHGIHTLVETCGQFDADRFIQTVLPWLEAIYFDLKIMDSDTHRQYCGVGNETILDNFYRLVDACRNARTELLPRTPLIPGITDTEENLSAIVDLLRRTGQRRVQLMEYNPLGREKRIKIGRHPSETNGALPTAWMPREHLVSCQALFQRAGIETV